jgi:hypothetical protein
MSPQQIIQKKKDELVHLENKLIELRDYSHTDFIKTIEEHKLIYREIKKTEEEIENIKSQLKILENLNT